MLGPTRYVIALRADGRTLTYSRTGLPTRELLGLRGTRFAVKDQPGVLLEFLGAEQGAADAMGHIYSGGSAVAKRER